MCVCVCVCVCVCACVYVCMYSRVCVRLSRYLYFGSFSGNIELYLKHDEEWLVVVNERFRISKGYSLANKLENISKGRCMLIKRDRTGLGGEAT